MVEKITVDSLAGSAATVKIPETLVVVNPDKPLYGTEYLCVYLSELPELSPDGQVINEPDEPFK